MHRLAVALTTLLTLVGVAVVVGYLFIFGPSPDRAAAMAPSTSVAFVSVYLSPSTGQEMSLADLLTRLPGLEDRATLADKLDEIVQRSLGDAGIDYHANVKPWLGDQLAVALVPAPAAPTSGVPAAPVVFAGVRDSAEAEAAIRRIAEANGGQLTTGSYAGVTTYSLGNQAAGGGRVAILDDMLVATAEESVLQRVIDTAQGNAERLSDASSFRGAMRDLPSDRLASAYVNVSSVAALGGAAGSTGYSAAGLAVVAHGDGLQVVGRAPYDASTADASSRANHALATEPSGLTDWMPASTQGELVIFGAQQVFETLASQLGAVPGGQDAAQSLTQLRALVALGLGIDFDRDLLPLFDHESAIALGDVGGGTPHGQLLLRPSDADAAADTLSRLTEALRSRGSDVTRADADGVTVTSIAIPQIARVAYAMKDGIIIVGLSVDDVAAALSAHASGETLGASTGYRAAFDIAGGRGGNELYLDGAQGMNLILGLLGQSPDSLPTDVRDILSQIRALAISVPAQQNSIEIHATVTVR